MKDLKIGTQLKLAFAVMLLFVVVLGVVSYRQTGRIQLQAEIMFDHPLQVRKAIGTLQNDVLKMRLGNRDLMLAKNEKEKQAAIESMALAANDALRQFAILKERYLGPVSDINEAFDAFTLWKTACEESSKLITLGEIDKVKESVSSTGVIGIYRDKMIEEIKQIDDFAENKGNSLYISSGQLAETLNQQLVMLIGIIVVLFLVINYLLLKNIRRPVDELTEVSKRFQHGDMDARSLYRSKNEFGLLSESFNAMVGDIQVNTELEEKVAYLSGLMLTEYDAKKFFQVTLNALVEQTGSQIAAIYLLSKDRKTFEHFESIGAGDSVRQSFVADQFEGEFGPALASKKIHYLKNIPEDTRFVFHSVSGKFIPREIITIPILADNEVIAILSLSGLNSYTSGAVRLVENIFVALCARIEGILGYHKMQEFSQKLELQNRELEAQKTELASQSSELIEQNAELEMQKKQLYEASRLKTNFLSNMSHELRTPLNSVIALSGVLNRRLENKIPVEEFSYLQVIERNGKHLLTLINDILDISRIEAGKEEADISKFNVHHLIGEVVSMIDPQARHRNIKLVDLKDDSDLFIFSDMNKCRHILQNLIGNAVKFTEKGKVEVTTAQSENRISIAVSDTGIGISEKHLPHIFDEFRQADGSTSRRYGGTGLGLAIAKKYANFLGGTISVKSTLGEGSAFTVTLPLKYAAGNRLIEPEQTLGIDRSWRNLPEPAPGSAGKTVLLVEDSEPAVIQIKDILEDSGFGLMVATDGLEALGIISKIIPDAIVLDLMMPGIDGFEVLKTIREAEPTALIPVLILTAKHITKDELSFLKRNNVHQLIQKGDVNRLELLNAISSMVYPKVEEKEEKPRELQVIEGMPVVLIVEDNPDNMITVKAMLVDHYTVIEATDGYEGIAKAKKHIPNLILMDIELPGIDGIEAFKSIRNDAQLQHIPVIALTASAMTSDRETILAHGLDAFIPKPIDEKMFFKTINSVLYGTRKD